MRLFANSNRHTLAARGIKRYSLCHGRRKYGQMFNLSEMQLPPNDSQGITRRLLAMLIL
jgi:hypothetical protein